MSLVLLVSCPDAQGIVAAVSRTIAEHGGNIVDADQHADGGYQRFLQRVEIDFSDPAAETPFRAAMEGLATALRLDWSLHRPDERARLVILVSRQGHCLADLLGRAALGELQGDIVEVISNHDDHAGLVGRFGTPFTHLPVDPASPEAQQAALAERLDATRPDLVVLARYMQILPPSIVEAYRFRVINIHHSFLPAFVGARPYHQAHERGVKVIGATAHYATADLDQGPIICQDVTAVSHRDGVDRFIKRGRDLEQIVLARAVSLHLEHRVLAYGNRTVVFD